MKYSISFSFLKEIEQAEIVDSDTTLPGEERFRFVIRPKIVLRVTENLRLNGYCYVKLPAFEPRERDDKLDYRVDAQIGANLELSQDCYGNEKVGLNVRYDYRFDNTPPCAVLNGALYTASRSHGTATLGISVSI